MTDKPDFRPLPPRPVPVVSVLRRYWHLVAVVVVAAAAFGNWFYTTALYDTNYMPLQPIPYSHRLHAGELGIDCQYCHYNAERGKHAGVPPVTICMGCHSPDMGGAAAGSEKIAKLLEMTDPELATYVDTEDLDDLSYGENVNRDGGMVHWNRIHKLPDHAYFLMSGTCKRA